MRRSHKIGQVAAAAIGIPLSQAAPAQSIRGAMGPQSRATIEIRVSVAPRFSLQPTSNGVGGNEKSPALLSNAPGLRVRLLMAPRVQPGEDEGTLHPVSATEDTAAAPQPKTVQPPLLLISPD